MPTISWRPFDPQRDMEPIFRLYQDPQEQALFAQRVPITSVDEFAEWFGTNMRTSYHDFHVVEDPSADHRMAGFVFSYDYHPFDLHCKVCLYAAPAYRGTGLAAVLGASFLDELFSIYPLHKVYALVYDYNGASLRSNQQAGFVEEGVMRDYRYLGGSYHDCHILAMTREAFGERLARFNDAAVARVLVDAGAPRDALVRVALDDAALFRPPSTAWPWPGARPCSAPFLRGRSPRIAWTPPQCGPSWRLGPSTVRRCARRRGLGAETGRCWRRSPRRTPGSRTSSKRVGASPALWAAPVRWATSRP